MNPSSNAHIMKRILVLCLGTLAAACLPAGAVTLGEALNATNLTWTTGGAAAWLGQATNTHDGYAAAQSGTVTDTQETWIETTVTGPSTLSFWWKVSSEFGWDFLQFKVGTNINSSVSGEEDWQQRTVYLGAGTQTLQWVYLKDDIYWSGEDAAWLDEVSWVPGGTLPAITTPPAATTVAAGLKCTLSAAVIGTPPLTYEWRFNGVSLADGGHISGATTPALVLTGVQTNDAGGYSLVVTNSYGSVTSSVASLTILPAPDWLLALVNALDATNLVWSPGGDANWFSQTNTTHDGVDAARSGIITNSQSSTLETTVSGPGRLNYWCKVSSQFGWDFLQFRLGTNVTSSLSGEVAWEQHTVYLGPGTQTLQWEYLKYGIYSSGQGVAWLDEVSWVPGGTIPAIATQPVGANLSAGLSYTLNVVAEGTPLLNYQWQLNGTNLAGATDPMLRFASLQAGSAGDYRVVVTNNYGAVTSQVARVTVLPSAPVITSQPRSQGVALGQDVALVVAARGTEPLAYQWLKNGTNVPGASGAVLSLPDFQASAVGVYQVVVSNTVGTVTSVAVALGVVPVIGWGSNSDGQTNVPISATNVMAVAAGYYHNLAVRADGTVIGWGATNGGQTEVPVTANSVVAVAGSYYGSFALRADGTVLAWGYNFYGQATVPANATNVVALAAGYAHTLALRADGTVGAWGYNSYGQATVPANATNVAAVAAGYNHSLGLCADGSVLAWGANTYNQTSVPASATNVMAVAAGYRHSLAVRADGTVIAWGDNSYGQASVPASATNIVAVSAGYRHSLALRADGAIVVWGSSSSGQTSVPDCATNVLAISAGYNHSLALLASSFSPSVMLPMAQRTAYVGETVSLVAAANGGLPLRYQWRCNGTNLLDGGRIRGASTPGLLLTGVQANDAASYSVVVTNTYGSVTSSVAVLSVEVPPPFTYTTYNGTVTITGYTGPGGGVTIPDTIHGLPVTSIGNYACFNSTNLTSITIPNSVTSIGDSAFYYCPSLTSVTIGNGVTNIGKTAFAVCGLTNIALPGSVISIGADAFYACYGLTSVAIPASVNHIGDAPFRACGGLVAITVDPANAFFSSVDGVLFTKNLTTLIKCPPGAKAGTYTLPSSVTSIGVDAFQGCYKLTNVGLPVGVTNIASAAFGGCSGLTSITIPAGVSSIGGNAFAWCTSMQAVYFQGNAPSLGLTVFNGANQATVYYLPGTTGWGTTFGDRPTAPWYAQPSITTQPSNQALWAEGNVTFVVGAMGEEPLSYQWQFNGTNVTDGDRVSGVHTPALVLSAVQTNDAGSYSVIVANNYGSVTSAVASLTVWVVPVVTAQPQGLTNNAGTVASFSVVATGVAPLNYQWWKDGVALRDGGNIAGAAMAVMTLTNVLGGDAGGYNVLVSSAQGSVTSVVAVLKVRDPFIANQPVSQIKNQGESVFFTVTAVGTAPLNYQWRKAGTPLAGATASSLTLSNLQSPHAGNYDVVLSNGFGSMTSFVASLTVIDPFITSQPASQQRYAGESAVFTVVAGGTVPVSYQWSKDGVVLPQATGASLTLTNLQGKDGGNYTVAVSNTYGVMVSAVARLTVFLTSPTLDSAFNPGVSGGVWATAEQTDGKILVGGAFTNLAGQTRSYLARLNADGTLDSVFAPEPNAQVWALAVLADGSTLVGGEFTTLSGLPCSRLARLKVDGTLDTTFNPMVGGWQVYALAVQPDGRILAGGSFTTINGQTRNRIARLNADGTLDGDFNPNAGGDVFCLALQPDGKILAGGYFTTMGGQPRSLIARLNADGTTDGGFNPGASSYSISYPPDVSSISVQADGKLLVVGNFATLAGQPRDGFGRLNADGTLDGVFNPGGNNSVSSLAIQADGKILVGGGFSTLAGQPRNGLGRLNANGTLDPNFNYAVNSGVYYLALQANGQILVGGDFTTLAGQPRNYLGRLNNTGPSSQGLSSTNSTITWLRGGTGPEVWRTSFDYSTNGITWTGLGVGTRITNGWQLAGVSVPANSTLRAHGYVTSGRHNGSSWVAEAMAGPPAIGIQPQSFTANAGATVTMSLAAGGTEPLLYQWLKDGVVLVDRENISGAMTPTLSVSNVLKGDEGGYSVMVRNSDGTVASAVARLTVVDPCIITQPTSQHRNAGESVVFSVTAAGTRPFSYQWWKDGVTLPQATGTTLSLANLQATDVGNYRVVVSNPFGSVTSLVACLTVNLATLDSGFNPATGQINAMAVQADGGILVGGYYYVLCRLTADGSVDARFHPALGGSSPYVNSLAVQPDGKILVGGTFETLGGQPRANLGRLNADGTLDGGFNPGAGNSVVSLAVQPDGKILVGGFFTTLGGQPRNRLARLNSDGTLDTEFNPGPSGVAYALAIQADGKILVGGSFTTLGGQPRNNFGRLNADGTVDSGFNPGADRDVYSLVVQSDGRILVGGWFGAIAGQGRGHLARLNADGIPDPTFTIGAGGGQYGFNYVYSLALQADGKIIVGGAFTTLGGQTRNRIGRINPDGSLDAGFDPGADDEVYSLAVLPDGKVLVGGDFTTLGGRPRSRLGRLNNTEPANQSIRYDGSTITWLRSGTSPEAWRTTFDYSTDGFFWTALGEGSHVPGGWQRPNAVVPMGATIRARGHAVGGIYNGSGWFVESLATNTPAADLHAAAWDTPMQAIAGQTVAVAWTIVNRGRLPATNGWLDRVYLSPDATVSNGSLLGEFPACGPLATNQSMARSQTITLPLHLPADRDYWWILMTDAGNAEVEENEANNTRVSEQPMWLLPTPAPNLRVATITPPANPMSGQSVTVSWTVTNTGNWSTGAGLWLDAVYLSTTPSLDGSALLLGRAQRPRSLGTNESYSCSLTATLPQGLSGTCYFIVQTDTDNRVNEGAFESDNTTASVPMAITLTPPPDLQVANITAPSNALSGTSLAVSWVVTNVGPGLTAESDWSDDVYLSPTNTPGTNAILLGSFPHAGALTNGQSYHSSASIPLSSSLSGSYYLLVHTDARNQVFEHVFEANNVTASLSPIVVTLAPPPDLAVAQVTAPATALASHALTIGYAVTNRGTDTFLSYLWEDHLYLTTNVAAVAAVRSGTLASVAIFASEPQSALLHFSGLYAGQSYSNTFTLTLPNGLSGPFYAIVETDSGGEVFELVRTNNLRVSAAPIAIESRPSDIVVASLTAPSSAQAGGSLLVSWTVRNQGTGDTAVSSWTDRLVLSTDAVAGNADDVTLLNLDHNGLLATGASHTVSNQVVTVPFSVAPGSYRLFLLTDSGNAVYEAANEANNSSTPRSLTITRTTADIRLASISLSPLGGEGQGEGALQLFSEDSFLVSWRVENTGSAAPNSTTWADAAYLSTNSVFDTNAVLLAAVQNPASLAPGTFYTNILAVALPAEIQGTFFVHVMADAATEVIEDNKANNTLAATNILQVKLRPVPDLAVHSVASPADGFSGQPFELSWTVTNRGPATADGIWYDSVYLSMDAQFDPDLDTYIGYAERPTALTNGQSYTQTALLEIPPNVSGLFYVFVVSDSTQRVNERGNTDNNVARAAMPVSLWLHPPADLVVGTITIPTNAVAGYDTALTYVLHNQGTNAAFGPWADALYLSADDQWDIGDVLIARVSQGGFLAAGGSRTNTVSAPVPGVLPGNYHVIIRTDLVNQVPETNEFNNITATLNQTASEVRELALGAPATDQLANHQARYYRVHVSAGQVLVLELDCASATAATELFIRYGAIPTRSEFDFIHSNPLQSDHRIVVPDTREGDYYILAYGDFIPAPGSAAFTITARLSQFLVFDTAFGRGGNAGNLTIPINGVDFDRTCTAWLTNAAGLNRRSTAHHYVSSTIFYPTFDLRGLAPGLYTVAVQNGDGATVTIPDSVEVVAAVGLPSVIPVVSTPNAMRRNVAYNFTVQWGNAGLNDAPAPLLTVGNTVPFGLTPGDYSLGTRYTFLGINTHGGPPGILRPGQVELMTFHSFSSTNAGTYTAFADRPLKAASSLYDWDSLRKQLTLGELLAVEFDRAFVQLITQIGPTQDGFQAMLSRNCSLLPKTLGDPRGPDAALQIEWNRAIAATGSSISGRISAPDLRVQFGSMTVTARNPASGDTDFAPVLLDGTFTFPRLASGVYELSAMGALLNGGQPVAVGVNAGQAVTNLVLNATLGATVHGVVYDAATGRSIAGATITILGSTNASAVVTSDGNGGYAVSGISSGTYSLVVESPGKARKTIQNLEVLPNGVLEGNIPLAAEARISGTVITQSGIPVSACGVILYPASTNSGTGVPINCIAGAFTGTGIEPSTYHVAISANGYLTHWTSNVTLSAGTIVQLPPAVLLPTTTISGRVIDRRTGGNTETMVSVFSDKELVATDFIGDDGYYSISGLPPGYYSISTLLVGSSGIASTASARLNSGQSVAAADIVISTGATLRGQVLQTGTLHPVSNLPVALQQSDGAVLTTVTDTNGFYSFSPLAVGTHHVSAGSLGVFPDYAVDVTNVDYAIYTNDIVMAPAGVIFGVVSFSDSQPIPDATVTLLSGSNAVSTAISDSEGNYRFYLKRGGTYSLRPSASAAYFPVTAPVLITEASILRQDFIAGNGTLEVTFAKQDGSRLSHTAVCLSQDAGSIGTLLKATNATSVQFTNVAPGIYWLAALADGNWLQTTQFVFPEVSTATTHLSLQAAASMSGTVVDNGGLPVINATVEVFTSATGQYASWAMTDSNGNWEISCIKPGLYDVIAFAPQYERSVQSGVQVGTGASVTLKLALASAYITGIVRSGSLNRPLVGVSVVVLDENTKPCAVGLTDSTGAFLVGVPCATPLLVVMSSPGFVPSNSQIYPLVAGATNSINTVMFGAAVGSVQSVGTNQTTANDGEQLLSSRSDPSLHRESKEFRTDTFRVVYDSWFDYMSEPTPSPYHTSYPEGPAEQCLMKKCATLWKEAALAVEAQDNAQTHARGVGMNMMMYRQCWWAKLGSLLGGIGLTAYTLPKSFGEVGIKALPKTLPAFFAKLGEPLLYAGLEKVADKAIENAGASEKVMGAQTPGQLVTKSLENVKDGAEVLHDLQVNRKVVENAFEKAKALSQGFPGPNLGRIADQANLLSMLDVLDAADRAVKGLQAYNGGIADTGEAVENFKNDFIAANKDYYRAAANARLKFLLYHTCLSYGCDPCQTENPPTECKRCNQPNPPDDCSDTDRPPTKDPNDIVGPAGYGPEQWIAPDQTFHYTVRFENDAVKAVAPAQYVRITQLLSTNLDLRTFRLGVMGFGTNLVDVPSDRAFFQTKVNVTNTLGVELVVIAGLDLAKGEVTWEFTSLDPATGDLPFDPYLGFLPPNTNGIIGQGFVTYTTKPKAGIATGGIINAQARIFFDYNEPMDTPNIFNTVDVNLPTSTMLPLPLTTNRNIFPVRWAGADACGGAGISSYTIYVSDNSGPWQPWLANTPQMESLFVGQCGHSYQFYSVARDHVGNVEAATPVAQAAILLLPNQPPVLEPITNRWLAVGQALSITNRASDPDAGQQVTFGLAPGTPAGMAVNPTNGVLTWTPACVQGSSTNVITVIATDDGCGNLISAQSFAINVTECLQTGLGYAVGAAGGGGCFPVSLESSFGLTNLTFAVRVPAGRFTNFTVTALAPEVGSATVLSLGTTQAVVTLVPQPGQLLRGPKQFAQICFSLLPDQSSAFVWMEVQDILGLRENGTPIGNTSGQPGRTVVVSEHPLLECVQVANGKPGLLLYARPGWTCAIEERGSVGPEAVWREINRVMATNLVTTLPLAGTNRQAFYRAVRFLPLSPRLSVVSATGPVSRFKLTGKTNASYTVQTTTNLPAPGPWQPLLNLTLTNGWGVFDWTNAGEARRFFRAVEQ
jgi:uncharacterized delta-60 repeat protein